MKIAHIVCTYPPYFGGMGNVVFQTAAELSKRGHDVEVFTPDYYGYAEVRPQDADEAADHTEPLKKQIDFTTRLKPSFSYGNAARLHQLTDELVGFDIVHLHYPFFGTANIVRRWKLKHPEKFLVVTYHMDNRAKGWKGLLFMLYAKFWLPKILSVADMLIASSFDYLAASDAAFSYRKNHKKWQAIPFGVDTNRFFPQEKHSTLLRSLQLQSTIPTVLFVGGMDTAHYFKGIPVLLRALLLLQKQGESIQAILVGEGNMRDQFTLRAKAYGLTGVRFVGGVSDEELPRYYQSADILVLPSTSRGEAFGMVLLEAMASGMGVIASDIPGVRTVAVDGGMVFEPGNAEQLAMKIKEYISSGVDGEQIRQMAVEKYSWQKIVDKLEEVYFSVVNK